MKKGISCVALALLISLSLLLPGVSHASAAGTEPTRQEVVLNEDLIAGVEFTTAPIFSLNDSYQLAASYNVVSYWQQYAGNVALYNKNGKTVTQTWFWSFGVISDRLFAGKTTANGKYAIYRDGVRITEELYKAYKIQCGCLVCIRDDGRDFFDMEGNRLTLGTIPSGYEPRFMTPAGTVVARIRNTSMSSSTGDLFYNYVLLDRTGKILARSDLTGRNEVETITADHIEDGVLVHNDFYDCIGTLICPSFECRVGTDRFVGLTNERDSQTGETKRVAKVYDKKGKLLNQLDADRIPLVCGDVIVFEKNGRYGLADRNGSVLVPATYLWLVNQQENLRVSEPEKSRIILRKDTDSFCVYTDQGDLVIELDGYYSVGVACDRITATNNAGELEIYDLNGNLLARRPANEKAEYTEVNGVRFVRPEGSGAWFVADLLGNRITETGFTNVTSDGVIFFYGLANVYQDGWYVVNAAGQILNAEKMDNPLQMGSFPLSLHKDPAQYLGVYTQNGKAGICRYVPPVGACEKSGDGKHCWKTTKVIKAATCIAGGQAEYCCEACGKKKTAETPVDKNAHVWTFTERLTEGPTLHESTGRYTCSRCAETKEAPLCAGEIFTDMPKKGKWSHDPIDWAFFSGVTAGASATTFSPGAAVTRGQTMTFLWNALGKPEPETQENPFQDVKAGKYHYKPVLWAVENGITTGTSETTFSPKKPCTRAQIVTFLWVAAGKPEPETQENPFQDVKAGKYYYKAVLWAVENGITGGTSKTTFSPNKTCTREQTVTFLYKALEIPQPEEP